jgi:hypothetical protein
LDNVGEGGLEEGSDPAKEGGGRGVVIAVVVLLSGGGGGGPEVVPEEGAGAAGQDDGARCLDEGHHEVLVGQEGPDLLGDPGGEEGRPREALRPCPPLPDRPTQRLLLPDTGTGGTGAETGDVAGTGGHGNGVPTNDGHGGRRCRRWRGVGGGGGRVTLVHFAVRCCFHSIKQ